MLHELLSPLLYLISRSTFDTWDRITQIVTEDAGDEKIHQYLIRKRNLFLRENNLSALQHQNLVNK